MKTNTPVMRYSHFTASTPINSPSQPCTVIACNRALADRLSRKCNRAPPEEKEEESKARCLERPSPIVERTAHSQHLAGLAEVERSSSDTTQNARVKPNDKSWLNVAASACGLVSLLAGVLQYVCVKFLPHSKFNQFVINQNSHQCVRFFLSNTAKISAIFSSKYT